MACSEGADFDGCGRIAHRRTRPPSPQPGLCKDPEGARVVLIQPRNGNPECAIISVTLCAAAAHGSEQAGGAHGGTKQCSRPHCSLSVLEQRFHKLPIKLGVPSQLAAVPGCKAGKGAYPKSAVTRGEQSVDVLIRKMLTRRWLPGDTSNTIEAKQPEFRAEPEVSVARLGNGVDIAFEEAVPGGPRGVRVLTDIQRWV